MNLTLHWLRRDLRRHAPALALWALLVALFTWARIWLRTHPQFFIGDRDLWLSLPAAGLGFAEICLLLRVLLDDPARGAQAFWKTRPPSGGSVFAAKAVILVLAALVIPFAAEGVFLAAVGESAGTPERVSLYLLPAVLALLAGAVSSAWKSTLLWLPLAGGAIMAAGAGLLWMGWKGSSWTPADHRLVAATLFATTLAVAAFIYRRRCAGKWMAVPLLVVPLLVGVGMAATGWPFDARLDNPPPGMKHATLQITWSQEPRVSQDRYDRQWSLALPLRIGGLPEGAHVMSALRSVSLESSSVQMPQAALRNRGWHRILQQGGQPLASFQVKLSEEEAASLQGHPWTVSGTLVLRVFDRRHHSLTLDRKHTVEAGTGRWIITPASLSDQRRIGNYSGNPDGRFWIEYEFTNPAPLSLLDDGFIDSETARLHRAAGDVSVRVDGFYLRQDFLLWEGVGRGGIQRGFGIAQEAHELYDPATWKNWTLDLDTLTLAGTLEIPFTLTWLGTK